MEKVSINIKVNSKEKKEAEKTLENMGISMSTAINMYIIQIAKQKRIPFEIEDLTYEERLKRVMHQAEQRNLIKTYNQFIQTEDAKMYALAEDEEKYYNEINDDYKIGDIVYVSDYMYKNGKTGTKHLFVIINKEEAIEIDYFGFLISSKIQKQGYKYNKRINKNSTNKLQKDSIVKCDDLIKISPENIKFKIGNVSKQELNEFLNIYEKVVIERNIE